MTGGAAWAALEAPWRACLSLAWEAYGANTIPVGAVLVDGGGAYGGGDRGLVGVNPHVERVPLRLEGPREDEFGVLASALLLAFYLRRRPGGHVVRAYAERMPAMTRVAEAIVAAGGPDAGATLDAALPAFWEAL